MDSSLIGRPCRFRSGTYVDGRYVASAELALGIIVGDVGDSEGGLYLIEPETENANDYVQVVEVTPQYVEVLYGSIGLLERLTSALERIAERGIILENTGAR